MAITIPPYVTLDFKRQARSSKFRENMVPKELASCYPWFLDLPVECLATLTRYIGGTYVHKHWNKAYGETPMGLTQRHVEKTVDEWLLQMPPDDFGAEQALEWCQKRLGVVAAAHNWGQANQGRHEDCRNRFKGRIKRELGSSVSLTAQTAMEQLRKKMAELQQHLRAIEPAPAPKQPWSPEPPVPEPPAPRPRNRRKGKKDDPNQGMLF